MKLVSMLVVLASLFFVTGCSPQDKECPVPGCPREHGTQFSYIIQRKVAPMVVYGETNITVEEWVAAWDCDNEAEVQDLLAHLRYYVKKQSEGLDVNYRKPTWEDKNLTWSLARVKKFLFDHGK